MNARPHPESLKTLLRALEDNIRSELEVQLEIQSLLDEQLEVLLQGGTEKIPGILETAEAGLETSRELENERAGVLRQIAATLGRPVHELSLDVLEQVVGDPASGLREVADELKQTLSQIRESNRTVQLLIRHSLLFIEDLIRTVTGQPAAGAPTYTSSGQRKEAAVSSLGAEA